ATPLYPQITTATAKTMSPYGVPAKAFSTSLKAVLTASGSSSSDKQETIRELSPITTATAKRTLRCTARELRQANKALGFTVPNRMEEPIMFRGDRTAMYHMSGILIWMEGPIFSSSATPAA